jgi:uncharacterized protein YegP (UPF0339 family)
MKAIIKKVSHGKLKGQFRFVLKGSNGEIIAVGETYTQKHNCIETLQNYFSNFEVVDKTN